MVTQEAWWSKGFLTLSLVSAVGCGGGLPEVEGPGREDVFSSEIFEPIDLHVHGPSVVELPNGDLLVAWFEGSGERWADDVVIRGARLRKGQTDWSRPFLLADTPGFPDINPVLFIDGQERLWLVWYTVLANLWETSLPKFRISSDYMMAEGPPRWEWQDVLHVKAGDSTERGVQPGDRFVQTVREKAEAYGKYLEDQGFFIGPGGEAGANRELWSRRVERMLAAASGADLVKEGHLYREDGTYTAQPMGYPLTRRLGWQTYNKPLLLDDGRMILPLYSDGFSFSLMAISDDWGRTWSFSEPLVGGGNIQPGLARRSDGSLVAYMRDNGPPPKRLHWSESRDRGETWSRVEDSALPNPGSGADIVTLRNGHWILVFNDLERGRHSLAVAVSENEGKSWDWIRKLEQDSQGDEATRSHYPAVVEGAGGELHLVYSHHFGGSDRGRTIKYARFREEWVKAAGVTAPGEGE